MRDDDGHHHGRVALSLRWGLYGGRWLFYPCAPWLAAGAGVAGGAFGKGEGKGTDGKGGREGRKGRKEFPAALTPRPRLLASIPPPLRHSGGSGGLPPAAVGRARPAPGTRRARVPGRAPARGGGGWPGTRGGGSSSRRGLAACVSVCPSSAGPGRERRSAPGRLQARALQVGVSVTQRGRAVWAARPEGGCPAGRPAGGGLRRPELGAHEGAGLLELS